MTVDLEINVLHPDGSRTVEVIARRRPILEVLEIYRQRELEAAIGMAAAVGLAREEGYSWSEIGRALGMTKQGAWQRFFTGSRRPV